MQVSSAIATPIVRADVALVANAARPSSEADTADFSQIADLNRKLQAIPDTRSEEVERGKELIQQPAYPPPYAIIRLARLLAIDLHSETDGPSDIPMP